MDEENAYMQFVPQGQASEDNEYMQFVATNKPEAHENFLKMAIKNSRMGPFGGTSITAIIPTSGQEVTDFAKVAGRQIPMTRGQGVGPAEMGPMGIGFNMAGIDEAKPLIPEPETEYGKNLEMSADIAPWAAMGLGGATAGAKGIHKFFSKGDLPQEIEAIKGSIQDIIYKGPKNVKERVGSIFDEAQDEFGKRMNAMPGGFSSQMTTDNYIEALTKTANELGGTKIPGSAGNSLMQIAEEMKANPRSFYPKEIQAQTKNILDSLPNSISKSKFYSNFLDILSREAPELADIKSAHAPIYDIAKQSKVINKGNLKNVVSGKAGHEQLGEMAQAQQMMGDSPNIVEQADKLGINLRDKQGQLQKIIGRQRAAKGIAKSLPYIGTGLGIGYGLLKD